MDITCQETLIININTFIINIDFAADFQQKRKEKKNLCSCYMRYVFWASLLLQFPDLVIFKSL